MSLVGKGARNSKRLVVYVDAEDLAQIEALAASQREHMSIVLRSIIRAHLRAQAQTTSIRSTP
jgi:hypothetical protein